MPTGCRRGSTRSGRSRTRSWHWTRAARTAASRCSSASRWSGRCCTPSRAGRGRVRRRSTVCSTRPPDLEPEWLLWLDVAERVAPSDVEALRDFLARDALPGLAYGLQRDGGGVAFRLFAYANGHRLSPDASDDAMVPAAIPRARWMATTLTLEPVTGSGPARSRPPGAPVLVPRDGSPGAADGPGHLRGGRRPRRRRTDRAGRPRAGRAGLP